MSERLLRSAKRIASGRHLPPEVRERFTEEIHDHLVRSAEEHRAAGLEPRRAERQALRDFGDVKKARVDLDRAWHGQRVVLFPDAPGEHLASFLVYDLKVILFILGLVILLRWQVVAAYHIPTKSMEPTLHGDPANGDKILVNTLYYTFKDPERFQVVVFEREGQPQNLIKRIAGLPGEELDIREGDIWIDGKIARKPPSVQEELLVPVFLKNRDVLAEVEGDGRTGLSAFIQTGEWTEDGRRFTGNAGAEGHASLGYGRTIVDEYPGGAQRENGAVVGDLVLRFKVRPEEDIDVVGAVLREFRDHFEVRIPVGPEGSAILLRNKEEVARAEGLHFERGGERRVRFENVDNRIRLIVDGEERIVYDVEDPSTEPGDTVPAAELGFRGQGSATFRDVELLRDIHYYRKDSRLDLPTRIPEGEYFMLGDNSCTSADSRNWGPIPGRQFIGRPLFVYYPLNRLKVVR